MSKLLQIIYASTSGHTEYVCTKIAKEISAKKRSITVQIKRVELALQKEIDDCDILLLASSTWNTGGIEGQLNPHMFDFVYKTLSTIDLGQKPVAIVGCGDDRYFYTCKAADYLEEFVRSHNGLLLQPTLRMINEPYHQDKVIQDWSLQMVDTIASIRLPIKK